MKLPCAAVRDLLPLFAENMTEPETRTLIEEHLRECPECQKKYAQLEPDAAPAAAAAAPIRTLKKETPDLDQSIFNSLHSVCLDTMPGWESEGEKHSFLDRYDRVKQGSEPVSE